MEINWVLVAWGSGNFVAGLVVGMWIADRTWRKYR